MKNSKYINYKIYTVLLSSVKNKFTFVTVSWVAYPEAVFPSTIAAFALVLKGVLYHIPSLILQELCNKALHYSLNHRVGPIK